MSKYHRGHENVALTPKERPWETKMEIVHQLQPWEEIGTWEHISRQDWYTLRRRPFFEKNWSAKDYGRQYPLIETCLFQGMSVEKTITVMKLWHGKHGRAFDEDDFWRIYYAVSDKLSPTLMENAIKKYWAGIRRIQFDRRSRDHSKMRVAYFLLNVRDATARRIADAAAMPIKTVRNALAALQASGKVLQVSPGMYKAIYSTRWDRAEIVTTQEGSYVWEDDHPSLYDFGVPPNERTKTNMRCWDYTKDVFVDVGVDGRSRETEWVIDSSGNVVENGTKTFGVVLGASGDFMDADEDVNVDYFALLTESVCGQSSQPNATYP